MATGHPQLPVRLVVLTLVCLTHLAVSGAQAVKPRLAIKTFDNPTTSANSTIGNALTDLFFTELGRTGRFQLVERAAFDEVAKGVDFGGTDWTKKGTVASRGGALGTQFILLGKVTNFSFDEQAVTENVATSRGVVAQTSYRQSAQVRVDFRVVSVATGVSIVTESGEDTQSTVSATSEQANYRRLVQVGMISAEAQNSLIGRATMGAIRNAVRKLGDLTGELTAHLASVATSASVESLSGATGQVIAVVGGGAFIVGVGSGQGIKVGDRLTVFAEQVTRDKQGQVVYREEQRIATLEVVDVSMADRARAKLVSDGAVQPKEGDKVRVDMTRAAEVRSGAPGPAGAVEGSDDVQRFVKQGDRYMEDKYFSQAVDAYQKALAVQPKSAVLLGKLASAFISNGRVGDAEELTDRLFAVGGELSLDVIHNHGLGQCSGRIVVSPKGMSYRPDKGNHGLDLRGAEIVDVGLDAKRPWFLSIRFLDERSKEQKYDFTAAAYFKNPERFIIEWLEGDPRVVADTQRLHRMLARVAQEKVLRK